MRRRRIAQPLRQLYNYTKPAAGSGIARCGCCGAGLPSPQRCKREQNTFFMPMPHAMTGLLVCEQCDAAHRKSSMQRGETARCTRCGARLERAQRLTTEGMLAMTCAAAVMFLIANIYPIVRVDVRGAHGSSTFWGAIVSSWQDGSETIAILAALTVFFAPLIELLAAGYVLWPLARGRQARHFGAAMRVL